MLKTVGPIAGKVALALAALFAVMVGLGLLLTEVLKNDWPVTAEDDVSRSLEQGRTDTMDDATHILGEMGNTFTIIGLMVVVALLLRWWLGRWRESLFVVLAVSAQAFIFMLTQLMVERQRPEVFRLDASPPTSSFPSGHTGAAIALYISTALVVLWHVRKPLLRVLLAALLIAIPFLVAYSRLYRGMHHPTDLVGSLVNGLSSILISAKATGQPQRTERRGRPTTTAGEMRDRLRAGR